MRLRYRKQRTQFRVAPNGEKQWQYALILEYEQITPGSGESIWQEVPVYDPYTGETSDSTTEPHDTSH